MPKYSLNSDGSVIITDDSNDSVGSGVKWFLRITRAIKILTVVFLIAIYVLLYKGNDTNELFSTLKNGGLSELHSCYSISVIEDKFQERQLFIKSYIDNLTTRVEMSLEDMQETIDRYRGGLSY